MGCIGGGTTICLPAAHVEMEYGREMSTGGSAPAPLARMVPRPARQLATPELLALDTRKNLSSALAISAYSASIPRTREAHYL
jgi:hypothetical protein